MSKFITAVFGAGVLGSVFALRTYLGIGLLLMVTTCSLKTEVVEYIKDSKIQAHEQRLAELNLETERVKAEISERLRFEAEEKANAELAQKENIRIEKERKQAQEKERVRKEKQQLKDLAIAELDEGILAAKTEITKVLGYNSVFGTQLTQMQNAGNPDQVVRIINAIKQNDNWIAKQKTIIDDLNAKKQQLTK